MKTTNRLIPALLALATLPACAIRVGVMSLQNYPSNTCEVVGPDTIKVKVKKVQGIDVEETRGVAWAVSNECAMAGSRKVEVFDFKQNGSAASPLDCPSYGVDLSAGQIGVIACKVKPGAVGTYKYSIKVDGVLKQDPDVIIKR